MFKPLRMSDTAVVCSTEDPAIDWDQTIEAIRKEGETTDQARERVEQEIAHAAHNNPPKMFDLLRFKSGDPPTRFTIGVISPDEMGRIQDECAAKGSISQMAWRAFLSSVRDISPWSTKPEMVKRGDVEYVAPDWLRAQFVRGLRSIAVEIGLYAWSFNRLTDNEVRLSS